MTKIFYLYIKDGRIEVTEFPRVEPPDKVVTFSNAGGVFSVKFSFD